MIDAIRVTAEMVGRYARTRHGDKCRILSISLHEERQQIEVRGVRCFEEGPYKHEWDLNGKSLYSEKADIIALWDANNEPVDQD